MSISPLCTVKQTQVALNKQTATASNIPKLEKPREQSKTEKIYFEQFHRQTHQPIYKRFLECYGHITELKFEQELFDKLAVCSDYPVKTHPQFCQIIKTHDLIRFIYEEESEEDWFLDPSQTTVNGIKGNKYINYLLKNEIQNFPYWMILRSFNYFFVEDTLKVLRNKYLHKEPSLNALQSKISVKTTLEPIIKIVFSMPRRHFCQTPSYTLTLIGLKNNPTAIQEAQKTADEYLLQSFTAYPENIELMTKEENRINVIFKIIFESCPAMPKEIAELIIENLRFGA